MYYDLCVNYDPSLINLNNFQNLSELITSGICDGFKIFAINTLRSGIITNNESIKDINIDIEKAFNAYSLKFLNSSSDSLSMLNFKDIKLLRRITFEISDTKEIYQITNLMPSLKAYDIVAIIPKNEKIFELACNNDLNVDLITINFDEKINFFLKKSLILSALDNNIFFEILYNGFITDNSKRAVFISNILMLLEITKGKNLIISSGSENYIDHRSPYDIINL